MNYKVNFFNGKWHVTSEDGNFKASSAYSREDGIFKFANLFTDDVRYQIIHDFFKSLDRDGSGIFKITRDALNYSNSNQRSITALLALNGWIIINYSANKDEFEYAWKVECSVFIDDDQDPEEPHKRGTIRIM